MEFLYAKERNQHLFIAACFWCSKEIIIFNQPAAILHIYVKFAKAAVGSAAFVFCVHIANKWQLVSY
jgi:hypothetical protein